MMERDLPEGWTYIRIGDAFTSVKDKIEPEGNQSYKYVGLEHLAKGGGIEAIGDSASLKSTKTLFKSGDVLYGKLRPYLNKHAITDFEGVCSTDILVFRGGNIDSSKFLNYYLGTSEVGAFANENSQGINLPRVSGKIMENLLIPLPPLAEQKRIVAKLDAAFAHLEKIKASLARIPELLKRFREAVLTQAVTGKLTEEWRRGKELNVSGEIALIKQQRLKQSKNGKRKKITFEECCDTSPIDTWARIYLEEIFDIETGATPKRDVGEYWQDGTIPWIKSGQVANGYITEANEYVTEKALYETNVKVYPVNTILVAMYGEGKTRGQVGILKLEATSNQAIAAMVNPSLPFETIKYVYYFGLSQYVNIRNQASGGNQPNLNTGKIKKWVIDFPPQAEQQEIVNRIESLFFTADAIESQYNSLKQKIDALPQVLLAKAFLGELVPQDPADEPAAVLLEKIRKEMGKLGKKVGVVDIVEG